MNARQRKKARDGKSWRLSGREDMTKTQKQRQIRRYNAAADRTEAKQGWTISAVSHIDHALQSITQAVACARFGGAVASVRKLGADQARSELRRLRRWCRDWDNNQQSAINRFHAKARRLRGHTARRGG